MQCLGLPHSRCAGGLGLTDLFGILRIALDQPGQYRGVVELGRRRGPLVAQVPTLNRNRQNPDWSTVIRRQKN